MPNHLTPEEYNAIFNKYPVLIRAYGHGVVRKLIKIDNVPAVYRESVKSLVRELGLDELALEEHEKEDQDENVEPDEKI